MVALLGTVKSTELVDSLCSQLEDEDLQRLIMQVDEMREDPDFTYNMFQYFKGRVQNPPLIRGM